MAPPAAANGERQAVPEEMSERERSIEVVKTIRMLQGEGRDLFERFGMMISAVQGLTTATLELTAAYRKGRAPSVPPPGVVASILPPARDKQQSYMDLELMAKQAASILDVESDAGEDTKITKITSNVQVLAGVIEAARVNAYNKLQRNARLKTIGVYIGIVGGGIPILVILAGVLLWGLKAALIYLKVAVP